MCLYSNGALVCCILIEHQCAYIFMNHQCVYMLMEHQCVYILMEDQCVIFSRNIHVLIYLLISS